VLVTGRLDQRSWQSEAGERRSKVEVSAEDLPPSLRWATAKLARTERHGAEERPGPPASSGYSPDEEPY
jgi:single-strand DNA-binding protein